MLISAISWDPKNQLYKCKLHWALSRDPLQNFMFNKDLTIFHWYANATWLTLFVKLPCLGPPSSRLPGFLDGQHGAMIVAMVTVCHECHSLRHSSQGVCYFNLFYPSNYFYFASKPKNCEPRISPGRWSFQAAAFQWCVQSISYILNEE